MQQENVKTTTIDEFEWFTSFQQLLQSIKTRVTIFHTTKQQRSTLSPSIRAMLEHKQYLQNKYRHNKLEEDRVRLRLWNKLAQYELDSFRQNKWSIFISQVAFPNPKRFWQTVKCLNKNKSSNFSAFTENDHIYKTPDEIINTLHEHFSNRFTAPNLSINNTTNVLASNLWDKLSNSSQHDIELVCENSDLKFTTHDINKIYEKLFLLKFDKWIQVNNILPYQQSDSRQHLSTLTRVNHITEQLTQSLNHNSFSVIVYVDFLQAFDMLWHHGFILKLYQLNCPYEYLFWIINYFKDRTITLGYRGHLSKQVKVPCGAPQGSYFGPKAYIVNHFDLPSIFDCPSEVHLHVDDLAILYSSSIFLKYAQQANEIETRINSDLLKLANYAESNHQPVNNKKTEFVIYHNSSNSKNSNYLPRAIYSATKVFHIFRLSR
ncbi:unnamed protein product [Rotaria magnacalcarata]